MKTLVISGSPHEQGDTMKLTEELCRHLDGDRETFFPYRAVFHPCIDCSFCRIAPGCIYDDDFTRFSEKLQEADRFVIVSPVHFGSLSGQLLSFFSRMQTYYMGKRFLPPEERQPMKPKRGALILTSGSVYPDVDGPARKQAEFLFRCANTRFVATVLLSGTDSLSPGLWQQACRDAEEAAKKLK